MPWLVERFAPTSSCPKVLVVCGRLYALGVQDLVSMTNCEIALREELTDKIKELSQKNLELAAKDAELAAKDVDLATKEAELQ